jgi:hypothetical protein
MNVVGTAQVIALISYESRLNLRFSVLNPVILCRRRHSLDIAL